MRPTQLPRRFWTAATVAAFVLGSASALANPVPPQPEAHAPTAAAVMQPATAVHAPAAQQLAPRALHLGAAAEPAREPVDLALVPKGTMAQVPARVGVLAARAATAPANVWPLTRVVAWIAHGEPFAGLSAGQAANNAAKFSKEDNLNVVVGRLAPTLTDAWSVRGAEKSFTNLVNELGDKKAQNPGADFSIAFDPDSLGYGLKGVPLAEREAMTRAAMMRIGMQAKQRGVGLEMDATELETMPFSLQVAKELVNQLKVPMRIALPARYEWSEGALAEWSALAKQTGLKLGVRLVKGSFLAADTPGTINLRKPLMDHYKKMITLALEKSADIDVAVATQNEDIWNHAESEAKRLNANFSVHVIRGVNPDLQAKMRAAGRISREYISYGPDAPAFGIEEKLDTARARKALAEKMKGELD